MVPAALMQVLAAIGPQATLHTTGPYYGSEQCPGLTASCSPKTRCRGARSQKNRDAHQHASQFGDACAYLGTLLSPKTRWRTLHSRPRLPVMSSPKAGLVWPRHRRSRPETAVQGRYAAHRHQHSLGIDPAGVQAAGSRRRQVRRDVGRACDGRPVRHPPAHAAGPALPVGRHVKGVAEKTLNQILPFPTARAGRWEGREASRFSKQGGKGSTLCSVCQMTIAHAGRLRGRVRGRPILIGGPGQGIHRWL